MIIKKTFFLNEYSFLNEIKKIIILQSYKNLYLKHKIINDLFFREKYIPNNYETAKKLHNYVRDNIKWVSDTFGIEVLQYPDRTLELGYGDCDDIVILLGTLYKMFGYKINLVLVAIDFLKLNGIINDDGKNYNHIYIEVEINNKIISSDASNKYASFGWHVPVEYLNKKSIILSV